MLFCDMFVIIDMILAITMVTGAAGAITELQLRIGYIRTATNLAAMIVIRRSMRSLPSAGERNDLGLLFGFAPL